MTYIMKKIKKITKWTFLGIILVYITLLIFPQIVFANKLEYREFTVYFHNIHKEDIQNLKMIIDKSSELIKQSELYDKEFKQKVFLCESYNEYGFFAPLTSKAFATNYPITHNIFLSKSNISNNSVIRNGKTNNKRTMSGLITHETVHSMLNIKLGTLKYFQLPTWKNEGYCDFIANESSYDKQKGLEEICNDNKTIKNPSFEYFKYRLLTQYLFEDKQISLEEFLNKDFNLNTLNKELNKKYCTQ